MKKEIKFRAWDKKEKRMSYMENNGIFRKAYKSDIAGWQDCGLGLLLQKYNRKEIKLQQGTGLKDKNGKMIFEGDIVKAEMINPNTGETHAEKIIANLCMEFGLYEYLQGEVIGNIYENKKLLK